MKTKEKIQTIEAHKYDQVYCYFIESDKAVSFDSKLKELFCWDVSNIKNWKKIYSVESENI